MVYFGIILNENVLWNAGDNATSLNEEKLEECGYHKSYFHGTAIRILNFDLFTNSLNLILQSFNLIGNACKLVEIFCKGKFS